MIFGEGLRHIVIINSGTYWSLAALLLSHYSSEKSAIPASHQPVSGGYERKYCALIIQKLSECPYHPHCFDLGWNACMVCYLPLMLQHLRVPLTAAGQKWPFFHHALVTPFAFSWVLLILRYGMQQHRIDTASTHPVSFFRAWSVKSMIKLPPVIGCH